MLHNGRSEPVQPLIALLEDGVPATTERDRTPTQPARIVVDCSD